MFLLTDAFPFEDRFCGFKRPAWFWRWVNKEPQRQTLEHAPVTSRADVVCPLPTRSTDRLASALTDQQSNTQSARDMQQVEKIIDIASGRASETGAGPSLLEGCCEKKDLTDDAAS